MTPDPRPARGAATSSATIGSVATGSAATSGRLLLTLPILERMREVEGWLSDSEADLLIASAADVLRAFPPSHALVEVGSYCGRSTVVLASVIATVSPEARVFAIDPHEGEVGASDSGVEHRAPTFNRFQDNLSRAGVAEHVLPLRQRSYEVDWQGPIGLLLIDGLHDYQSCARDFEHFEPWLAAGAHVAFHDYQSWPGVTALVDDLRRAPGYTWVCRADSLVVLRRMVQPRYARNVQ